MSRLLSSMDLAPGGTHLVFIFTVRNSDRLNIRLASSGYS